MDPTRASRGHGHASGIESCSVPLRVKEAPSVTIGASTLILIPAVQATARVEKVCKQLVNQSSDLIELVDYARNLRNSLLDDGTDDAFSISVRGEDVALSVS
jgi:hypothetical protein